MTRTLRITRFRLWSLASLVAVSSHLAVSQAVSIARIFDRSTPIAPVASAPALATIRGLAPVSATPERFIDFAGFIRADASSAADVDLLPWKSFVDSGVVPDTTGSLMVVGLDGTGARLASQRIDVRFVIPGPKGQPARVLREAPFGGVMRFPPGVVRFDLIRPDVTDPRADYYLLGADVTLRPSGRVAPIRQVRSHAGGLQRGGGVRFCF